MLGKKEKISNLDDEKCIFCEIRNIFHTFQGLSFGPIYFCHFAFLSLKWSTFEIKKNILISFGKLFPSLDSQVLEFCNFTFHEVIKYRSMIQELDFTLF